MRLEAGQPCKAFAALGTYWITLVGGCVQPQVELVVERRVAAGTSMGFVLRVGPFVALQLPPFGELAATPAALVGTLQNPVPKLTSRVCKLSCASSNTRKQLHWDDNKHECKLAHTDNYEIQYWNKGIRKFNRIRRLSTFCLTCIL